MAILTWILQDKFPLVAAAGMVIYVPTTRATGLITTPAVDDQYTIQATIIDCISAMSDGLNYAIPPLLNDVKVSPNPVLYM